MTGPSCRRCQRPLGPGHGRLCGYCAGLERTERDSREPAPDRDADPEELDAAQDRYEAVQGWGRDHP